MSFFSNLLKKAKKEVQSVGNFVKQNPTPYSYAKKQLPRAVDVLRQGKNVVNNQVDNFRVGMNVGRNPNQSLPTRTAQGFLQGTGKFIADTGSFANKLQSSRVANVLNPATLMMRKYAPQNQAQINQFKTNLNNVAPTTTAGKIGSFVGENLPAVALPASKGITAERIASPAARMLANSLLRGGENAAIQGAYRYARGEKITPKNVASDVGTGALFNALLSPKATGKGVGEMVDNYKQVKAGYRINNYKGKYAGKMAGAVRLPQNPDNLTPLSNEAKVKIGSSPKATPPISLAKTGSPILPSSVVEKNVSLPSNTTDPVEKIVSALKGLKPLSKEQRILNSGNRSKQYAKLMSARGKTSGESGYFAELGALKGGAPKVNFESVRPKLNQTDIDSLFNKINDSNIGDWEKVNAKSGLMKLLTKEGASMPTGGELKLMNDVFGSDMTKAILSNRTTWQKFLTGAGEVLNLPRALMASFDLSAPFRQGAVMTSRPKQFFPAFFSMFKQAGSDKAFKAVQQGISARPTYKLMRESKLALTDIGGDLAGREEMFMSNIGEKIPVLKYGMKASNRAYTGFLNKLRADVFDDMVKKAKLLGNDNPNVAEDIAKFVNSATGRGDLGSLNRAAPVLNSVFFSPRLMAARVNMLNPAYYTKLDPMVRKEAVKSMLTFGATAATVLGLAKAGGAEVGVDPRSADFGKIKVGDTRYDILGGFQQYIVLASRLISGKMVSSTTGKEISLTEGYKPTTRLDIIINFLKSKENPILSYITGFAEGTTQLGQQFNPASEAINRFIPMFAQDIVDLTEDKGFAKAIGMEIPSAFGVGVQTYGKQMPVIGTTPSGNSTIKWRNPYDIGERILNKVTGGGISPFSKDEQNTLDQTRRRTAQQKADVEKVVAGVQRKINKGETISGVTNLPDGRGMYVTDEGIKYADTPEKAKEAIFKEDFKKSDKNIQEYNGIVYRKNSEGAISSMPKAEYDYKLDVDKGENAKKKKDLKGWMDYADKQVTYLQSQLDDPNVDELDKSGIQQKIDTIMANADKYAGYGGFTKPKKNAKKTAAISALKAFKVPTFAKPTSTTAKTGRIALKATTVSAATLARGR